MFKAFNWKQPIDKSDLKMVLLNGFIFAILGGFLAGSADYLLNLINFPLAIGLIVMYLVISLRLRRSYNYYHILYPVLSIVFLLIASFISRYVYWSFAFADYNVFTRLSSAYGPGLTFLFLLGPFEGFFLYSPPTGIVFGLLDCAIYAYAIYSCYRTVKGRN